MFTRIQIEGLRGISEADIDGLKPVTILIGTNGSGKSTVLEAIGVACAGQDPVHAVRALLHREWLGLGGIKYWFPSKNNQSHIAVWEGSEPPTLDATLGEANAFPDYSDTFESWIDGQETVSIIQSIPNKSDLYATIDEDGEIVDSKRKSSLRAFTLEAAHVDRPAAARKRFGSERFSSKLRDALTELKLSDYYDDLIEYLQLIRPNLVSIESIAVGDRDEPHIFEKEPRVGYPVAYAGDGFRRTLLLAAAFARTKGGVVAIDEPEAFAHPRLFGSVAKMVQRAESEGTQVFLATHSLEFVQATLEQYENEPEKIAVVGLDNDRGKIDPVVISGENAYRRVVELGDDLRL